MDSFPLLGLFNSVALLLAVSFAFDLANAGVSGSAGRRAAVGLLIGLLGCALMLSGWTIGLGVKIDLRSALLGITGLYFGLLPTTVAALVVGAARVQMGGAGMPTGLLVIAVSALTGLAIRRWRTPEVSAYRWSELLGFGSLVHVLALACLLILPARDFAPTLTLAVIPALAIGPLATMALGLILNYRLTQQRAAAALRHSEARLRAVTENAPDIIAELDPAGRIRYLNRALGGYALDDVIGRDFRDWAPPEFHPAMHAALDKVFVDREPAAYEAQGAGAPGKGRWFASRLSPVIVGGEAQCAILVTRDVTRERAADDALRERERTYRAVLSTALDGFWMLDLEGRLLDANEAYARMSGYSRDELLRLSVGAIAAAQTDEEVAARMRYLVEQGGMRFETRHRRKNGSEFAAEVNASFSPADGGRVFVFVRDISASKRAAAMVRTRLELAALVLQGPLEGLVRAGIDAALRMTASTIGCFQLVEAGGATLASPTWSSSAAGTRGAEVGHRPSPGAGNDSAAADCLRQRRPVVRNDPAASAPTYELPEGHVPYARELAVPVLRGDAVVAVLGLGGKADTYDDADIATGGEVAAMLMDAVDRKRGEDRLRQAAAVFENTREGVMITDEGQRILMVNRAFCELTGYAEDEVLGRTPSLLKSGRHEREFYTEIWRAVRTTGHWQGEIWNRRKNGEVYPELLSISAVGRADSGVAHFVGVFADISRLKASEAQLEHLAHHDALTGLPNRLLMMHHLKRAIDKSRRSNRAVALLMLDLDRFKDVNDTFGHLAGDELLQQVAQRLTRRLRGADSLTRLGGDEFTVLLEDLGRPGDAARVARDIVELMNEPFHLTGGIDVRIGASVGISLFPEHADTAEMLLQQADTALYRAKDDGRGCFKYFSDEQTYAARERVELEGKLRRALERNQLRVFYQPLVDIASDRIVGAEALLRWQDPDSGLIAPARFIPVAEETGLIVPIGEWVLREVCRQGRQWIDAGLPPLTLAVNLSPLQFRLGDVGKVVAAALVASGFPAERLELELTEGALMERQDDAVETLIRLRAQGVRLAIDDFGTGYSSLAYLKRFPIDVLKIDRSFVEDIPHGEGDSEIAATIVAMGHTLGLKVLAEGVETEEQLAFLRQRGCDLYQGYLRSAAVPADEFELLV